MVVVGGPTGVKLAGTIAELARSTLAKDFRRIARRRPGYSSSGPATDPAVLPCGEFRIRARRAGGLGVMVRLAVAVDMIDDTGLHAGDEHIATSMILWCAGTAARPAASGSVRLRLTTAWFAWSMVHLLLLVDFGSRLSVYVN